MTGKGGLKEIRTELLMAWNHHSAPTCFTAVERSANIGVGPQWHGLKAELEQGRYDLYDKKKRKKG